MNALVLKTSKGASPSRVRIPPSPPLIKRLPHGGFFINADRIGERTLGSVEHNVRNDVEQSETVQAQRRMRATPEQSLPLGYIKKGPS